MAEVVPRSASAAFSTAIGAYSFQLSERMTSPPPAEILKEYLPSTGAMKEISYRASLQLPTGMEGSGERISHMKLILSSFRVRTGMSEPFTEYIALMSMDSGSSRKPPSGAQSKKRIFLSPNALRNPSRIVTSSGLFTQQLPPIRYSQLRSVAFGPVTRTLRTFFGSRGRRPPSFFNRTIPSSATCLATAICSGV